MTNHNSLDPLNNIQKNLCEYGGAFGILLSLTCLIQHFIAAIPNYITYSMIPAYIFILLAFLLLALQKPVSVILLMTGAVLALACNWIILTSHAFSLVVLFLFLYLVIILVALFVEQVPQKLKLKKAALKAERDEWAGKI